MRNKINSIYARRTYDSTTRKAFACWRKLVALAVSEGWRTSSSVPVKANRYLKRNVLHILGNTHIPERTVQGTSELRRVAHECDFVAQAVVNQGSLDSFDTTVHHITRSDAVCSCFGVGEGNLGNTERRRR